MITQNRYSGYFPATLAVTEHFRLKRYLTMNSEFKISPKLKKWRKWMKAIEKRDLWSCCGCKHVLGSPRHYP